TGACRRRRKVQTSERKLQRVRILQNTTFAGCAQYAVEDCKKVQNLFTSVVLAPVQSNQPTDQQGGVDDADDRFDDGDRASVAAPGDDVAIADRSQGNEAEERELAGDKALSGL